MPAFIYRKHMLSFFLFDPDGIIAGESGAAAGIFMLFAGSFILYLLGILLFERKDLHI